MTEINRELNEKYGYLGDDLVHRSRREHLARECEQAAASDTPIATATGRIVEIRARWEAGAGINPKSPTRAERDAIEAFEFNACEDMEFLLNGFTAMRDALRSLRARVEAWAESEDSDGHTEIVNWPEMSEARAALKLAEGKEG